MPTGASVEAFIAGVDHPTRRRDAETALEIFSRATGEPALMWGPSIIGFGRYRYQYDSGREGEMLAVGFSPRKAHMVMYIVGSIAEDDPLRSRLGKHKTSKACLYVNKFDDIDLAVLEQWVGKSYRATLAKYARD